MIDADLAHIEAVIRGRLDAPQKADDPLDRLMRRQDEGLLTAVRTLRKAQADLAELKAGVAQLQASAVIGRH